MIDNKLSYTDVIKTILRQAQPKVLQINQKRFRTRLFHVRTYRSFGHQHTVQHGIWYDDKVLGEML